MRRRSVMPAQYEINSRNAKKKLAELIKRNFTNRDYIITFVYSKRKNTADIEDVKNDIKNLFRRLKRLYLNWYKELKYIWIIKNHQKHGIYLRILMTGGVPQALEDEFFTSGHIDVKHIDGNIDAYVVYELEKEPLTYRRWSCSKNLKKSFKAKGGEKWKHG